MSESKTVKSNSEETRLRGICSENIYQYFKHIRTSGQALSIMAQI